MAVSDTGDMHILTDFSTIPDKYAKHAPQEFTLDQTPILSFPFTVAKVSEDAHFLHWIFVDPDSIPVCGFQWNHWAVANVPIDSVTNPTGVISIPEDCSRTLADIAAKAVQGKNSEASPLLGHKDVRITTGYVGPTPPNADHDYHLVVWATAAPLTTLSEGFWLNELQREIRNTHPTPQMAETYLVGRA